MSDQDEVKALVETTATDAKRMAVTDERTFGEAGTFLTAVQAAIKRVKDYWEPQVKKAHDLHKTLVASRDEMLRPLSDASAEVRGQMSAYRVAQERERAERQRLIDLEAQRQAEEERKKKIQEAEAFGSEQEVKRVEAAPVVVSSPILPPATPKVDGVSFVKNWKYRIIDEKQIPREFLVVDETKLGRLAKAMRDSARVPGVEFYCEEVVSARAR